MFYIGEFPAQALAENKFFIHIIQESLDNPAGHGYVIRILDLDIERNRTEFREWPHENRIKNPSQQRVIAMRFHELNRPTEPNQILYQGIF